MVRVDQTSQSLFMLLRLPVVTVIILNSCLTCSGLWSHVVVIFSPYTLTRLTVRVDQTTRYNNCKLAWQSVCIYVTSNHVRILEEWSVYKSETEAVKKPMHPTCQVFHFARQVVCLVIISLCAHFLHGFCRATFNFCLFVYELHVRTSKITITANNKVQVSSTTLGVRIPEVYSADVHTLQHE